MKLHHCSHTAFAPSLVVGVVEGRPGMGGWSSPPNTLTETHSEGQLGCTGSQAWMSWLVAFPQGKRDIPASKHVPIMLKKLVPQ